MSPSNNVANVVRHILEVRSGIFAACRDRPRHFAHVDIRPAVHFAPRGRQQSHLFRHHRLSAVEFSVTAADASGVYAIPTTRAARGPSPRLWKDTEVGGAGQASAGSLSRGTVKLDEGIEGENA